MWSSISFLMKRYLFHVPTTTWLLLFRPCSLLVFLNGTDLFWRRHTDHDGMNDVEEIKSDYNWYSSSLFGFVIYDKKVWCQDLLFCDSPRKSGVRWLVWGQQVRDIQIGRRVLITIAWQKRLFLVLKPRLRIRWLTQSNFDSANLRGEPHLTVQFNSILISTSKAS